MASRNILKHLFGLFLVLALLVPATSQSKADKASLEAEYKKAIADAKVAERSEISRDLIAIYPGNKKLVWRENNGKQQVLTVTWTAWTGYNEKVGQSMALERDIWITTVPELQNFCKKCGLTGDPLVLRLEQLLGLPPDDGKTTMVEIWVSPDDLFRPSPDPEICDYEADLDFPRSRYLTVSPFYIEWFNNQEAASYGKNGYPWTRLGYTYDWGQKNGEIGLSEFVIRQGAIVDIRSVNSTADYCKK